MVLGCELTEEDTTHGPNLELVDDNGHDTAEVEIAEAIVKDCVENAFLNRNFSR